MEQCVCEIPSCCLHTGSPLTTLPSPLQSAGEGLDIHHKKKDHNVMVLGKVLQYTYMGSNLGIRYHWLSSN